MPDTFKALKMLKDYDKKDDERRNCMVDKVAKRITQAFIIWQVIKEDDRDTYEYCFQIMLMNIMNLGSIVLMALIIGKFIETVLYMAGFKLIRKQAGGYHARTPLRCYIISLVNWLIFILILSVIPTAWIGLINIGMAILALMVIWRYAPVADINKPFSIGEYERYKRNSRLIMSALSLLNLIVYIISNIFIQVYMLPLNMGILFAAVSLLAARIINKDKFITDNIEHHNS